MLIKQDYSIYFKGKDELSKSFNNKTADNCTLVLPLRHAKEKIIQHSKLLALLSVVALAIGIGKGSTGFNPDRENIVIKNRLTGNCKTTNKKFFFKPACINTINSYPAGQDFATVVEVNCRTKDNMELPLYFVFQWNFVTDTGKEFFKKIVSLDKDLTSYGSTLAGFIRNRVETASKEYVKQHNLEDILKEEKIIDEKIFGTWNSTQGLKKELNAKYGIFTGRILSGRQPSSLSQSDRKQFFTERILAVFHPLYKDHTIGEDYMLQTLEKDFETYTLVKEKASLLLELFQKFMF